MTKIELMVGTYGGQKINVFVDSYDPIAMNKAINNESELTLAIGELIISRLEIKTVYPAKKEENAGL